MNIKDKVSLIGRFHVEIERAGKVISSFDFTNRVVDVGANKLLGSGLHGDAQVTAWYIGLVDNGSFGSFVDADTMSSHGGWIEFILYGGGARKAWNPDAPAARAIGNTTAGAFTISGNGTIHGAFVTSDNTLGGTTGTLWAEGAFPSNQPVLIGDVLRITYTVSIA